MTPGGKAAPEPVREVVLKITSRCNLDCHYCYVYHGPDQSWRSQPRMMSEAVIAATAGRIGEHARAHGLSRIRARFHGGEPLLAGAGRLERAIAALRAALPPGGLELDLQTNGVLLDAPFLEVLTRNDVQVSVSLDGSKAVNDRRRRTADGRGSHAKVARALRLLGAERFHTLFAGLLCVIDVRSDPVAVYSELASFAPPAMDFLLPLGNWSRPPARPARGPAGTEYADWLIALFDHWYSLRHAPRIRIFDEIIHLLLGGRPGTEIMGGGPSGYLVVETDGTIEGPDSLKSAYPGAARTGMSVRTHSFDDALRHPVFAVPRRGLPSLNDICQSCPVLAVCGGGQYAHRYRAGDGFDNPSVYCADLRRLITHIGRRVLTDLGRSPKGPR